VRAQPVGSYTAYLVGCRFEKAPLTVKVVLDRANRIAGLFFLPGDLSSEA